MSRLLTPDEVAAQLATLTGWTGDSSAITLTTELPSFPAAIAVVDDVAADAEVMNHHPDLDIRWRTVRFELSTHSVGGVTQLDIELAHQINRVIDGVRDGDQLRRD